ncbi:MAG: MCE family protein, partial [Bacteroidetes bacterium]|nr:MCE family protein [Bacteroidota bacterium]
NVRKAGEQADIAAKGLSSTIDDLHESVSNGKGTVATLLKDSVVALRFKSSLEHIEKGTEAFSQDMEALKHNFLFRGYFRKLEKQQKKANAQRLTMDE